jgi:CubicO group peptidase (beta-lactamase class C family)
MNSVMLVRHGHVIAEGWWEPYGPETRHVLYSLSKSFTSTAVGFAVAEGRLTIDDEVLSFFPEDAPSQPTNNLKAMRIRDLLTMSAGHQDETSPAADKISPKAFLAHPVPHKPGTHFRYNTAATFMLSAIVQKKTGQTVFDYLQPKLFEPLGITGAVWDTNWQGISLGGYGLSARTEDIARFGQLYLQKGKWNGKQLLPSAWIELATSRQVSNGSDPQSDWEQGYGFQFWRCRHNAYRGDGAFGQFCLVLPEQDAVLAITSGVKDMQPVLNIVWEKLLPALRPTHLRSDRTSREKLERKLASLKLPTVEGSVTSPRAPKFRNRRFNFPVNDQNISSITLAEIGRGELVAIITGTNRTSTVRCGHRSWSRGRGSIGNYNDVPIAACAAWTADDTCVLKICAYETPVYATWRLRFDGDRLLLDTEMNVAFGPTKKPQLVGTAANQP